MVHVIWRLCEVRLSYNFAVNLSLVQCFFDSKVLEFAVDTPRTLPGPRLPRMSMCRSRRSSAYSHETGWSRALALNSSSLQPFTVPADTISSISKYQMITYQWPYCPRFQNSPIRFGHVNACLSVDSACQNHAGISVSKHLSCSRYFDLADLKPEDVDVLQGARCGRMGCHSKIVFVTLCHPFVQLAKYFGDPW